MPTPHTTDTRHWNLMILKGYWMLLLIFVAATILSVWILYIHSFPEYKRGLYYNLLTLTPILAGILLMLEGYLRRAKAPSDYVFILMSTLWIWLAIDATPYIGNIYSMSLIPLLISLLYFDVRKIVFSAVLNGCSLLLIIFIFSRRPDAELHPLDIVSIIAIFIACLVVMLIVMARGRVMMRELERHVEMQQQLIAQNALMERISRSDALTGLFNHKYFHEQLNLSIPKCDACEGAQASCHLALLDIDNFKSVNDLFGHWVGDLVLRRAAHIIRDCVGDHGFPARYGGEEFAVLFTARSLPEALDILENIRHLISEEIHPEMGDKAVTISIGLRTYRALEGKEELFKQADAALYEAKRTGKNKIVVYSY